MDTLNVTSHHKFAQNTDTAWQLVVLLWLGSTSSSSFEPQAMSFATGIVTVAIPSWQNEIRVRR